MIAEIEKKWKGKRIENQNDYRDYKEKDDDYKEKEIEELGKGNKQNVKRET